MIRISESRENLVTFQNLGKKLINWEWKNDTEYTNRYALSHSVRLAIIILGIRLWTGSDSSLSYPSKRTFTPCLQEDGAEHHDDGGGSGDDDDDDDDDDKNKHIEINRNWRLISGSN